MIKKICTLFILLVVMLFTGCSSLSAFYASYVSKVSPAHSSTENSPSPSASPSYKPAFSPLPLDVKIDEEFSADINNDGIAETLEIINDENEVYEDNYVVRLSVSGASHSYEIDLDFGYCLDAYFARTQSGAVCLLVNISEVYDYTAATVIAFSGIKPVIKRRIEDQVYEVADTSIAVEGHIDVFGSWVSNRFLKLCDDFTFVPESDYQIVMGDRDPLHTIRKLPVQMLVSGAYRKQRLDEDSYIYPVSSDASSYVDFRLRNGAEGRIYYTREDYQIYIDGLTEDEYFDNLEYNSG